MIQEAEDQIAECEAELQWLQTRKEKIVVRREEYNRLLRNWEEAGVEQLAEEKDTDQE